ncbi:aminoglycoside phosphotransferase [Haloferax elongans ATCC BAA-1513]|uniref:Aminoglycoside phosphotransferase n=1 Tax=Haloferax elongans ATCC BAA-1513 TaxID=1230453 RepID=M0HTS5_HALEO|nr:aminoglycoside phosphotransferase family protein [Haloferax elongans]ELZ86504.1 aminoglycoside phosphotransferase [Haloferax elongans ATCC BAA-1513]
MAHEIAATLAQYASDSRIVRELHDVPPYRVYEVLLDDRRAVLKIDDHPRGHAAAEGRVHEYVATETSAPVPDVLAVGSDHYLTEWRGEFEESSETIDSDWAHAAGAWLGTLHADTTGEFGGFGQPRAGDDTLELSVHEDWVDAVRERIAHHRPFLSTVGYADVADAVSQFFRDHPHVFDGAGGPVLCHGDVHPEHVVRAGRGGTVAIDFEHALVAPAEYDYWRTVLPYIEADDDVDSRVLHAFRAGYESVHALPAGFEQRREVYLVLNTVAFIESLYLQKTVEPTKRDQMGEWMRTRVFRTLDEIRERES